MAVTLKKFLIYQAPGFSWTYGRLSIFDNEAVIPALVTFDPTDLASLTQQIVNAWHTVTVTPTIVPLQSIRSHLISNTSAISVARFAYRKTGPRSLNDYLNVKPASRDIPWYKLDPTPFVKANGDPATLLELFDESNPATSLIHKTLLPGDDGIGVKRPLRRHIYFLEIEYRRTKTDHPFVSGSSVRNVVSTQNANDVILGGVPYDREFVVWVTPLVLAQQGTGANEYDVTWTWHANLSGPWLRQHINAQGEYFYTREYPSTSWASALGEV